MYKNNPKTPFKDLISTDGLNPTNGTMSGNGWSARPNGQTVILNGKNEFGQDDILMKLSSTTLNGSAGFNFSPAIPITLDSDRVYRCELSFILTGTAKPVFYFGCGNYQVDLLSNGANQSNPYFVNLKANSAVIELNKWYVAIGYIYPMNTPLGTNYLSGGVYDRITGKYIQKGLAPTRISDKATTLTLRAFIFNLNETHQGYFTKPRVFAVKP